MTNLLESALVVATKDRPEYILGLLENLETVDYLPAVIIFVDSSADQKTRDLISQWSVKSELPLDYIRSLPGLPHQRNMGLGRLKTLGCWSSVHFLDDDVRVKPDYFYIASRLLMENPEYVAVGGFDEDARPPKNNIARKFFKISGIRGGGDLLKSGLGQITKPISSLQEVSWVPGGMLTIRYDDISSIRFDGRRRIHGEDIEMQIRLSHRGKIGVSKKLGVRHLAAKNPLELNSDRTYYGDAFRWNLAGEQPDRVTRAAVIKSTLGLALGETLLSVVGTSAQEARIRVIGHLKFFRDLILNRVHEDLVQHHGSGPYVDNVMVETKRDL